MTLPDSEVPATGRVGWVKHEIEAMLSTDEEYEEVIAFLQSKIKVSKLTHEVLAILKEVQKKYSDFNDVFDSVEDIQDYFFETGKDSEAETRINIYNRLDWNWIFEELQK